MQNHYLININGLFSGTTSDPKEGLQRAKAIAYANPFTLKRNGSTFTIIDTSGNEIEKQVD